MESLRRFPVYRIQTYRVGLYKCLVVVNQQRHIITIGNLICLSWSVEKQDSLCFCRASRHGSFEEYGDDERIEMRLQGRKNELLGK